MGQANAARDKLLDLRECNMTGKSAEEFDMAGVVMSDGDFSNVNFKGATLTKAIAIKGNFENADLSNTIADRATFDGSNLKNSIWKNAVLTTSTFTDADLEGADFTDAFIEAYGVKPLCANPTVKGTNKKTGVSTFESIGCQNTGLAR